MSSEIATGVGERGADRPPNAARRAGKPLAIQLLGPLTILGGFVWAIAQPYRIVFLHPHGKGLYDFLAQPPLLVVLIGVVFSLLIAPGLVQDLERVEHGSQG